MEICESVVHDVVIYPIKSCRGISLRSATICAQGLLHDHTFLIAARKTPTASYETVDLKKCPALIHVQPTIENSTLRITHIPTGQYIHVDLEPDRRQYHSLDNAVRLWKYPYANAVDLGPAVGSFFKDVIGVPGCEVRLCYRTVEPRLIGGNMPPTSAQQGRQIEAGLHEAFPLLVTSNSSLEELNSRLPKTDAASMYRFRANIVVDGRAAWDEDDWSEILISSPTGNRKTVVHLTARCGRCVVTTIDHSAAQIGMQPLKELRSYRKIEKGDTASSPVFGMYGVFGDTQGTIAVGDLVTVTKRTQDHHFIMPVHT